MRRAASDRAAYCFLCQLKTEPQEMVKICQQMLDQRDVEVL
jgi:hypothetical protein